MPKKSQNWFRRFKMLKFNSIFFTDENPKDKENLI